MDVNLSIAVGRPTGLPSDWIGAGIPSLAPDEAITEDDSGEYQTPSPEKRNLHHLIRLRRMQEEISRTIHSEAAAQRYVDLTWLEGMQRKIEDWRNNAPPTTLADGIVHSDWTHLNYNLTTSMLNRPSPGNPVPGPVQLKRALEASRCIMQIFKKTRREGTTGISESYITNGLNPVNE